jgi:hypothetical protein
LKAKGIKKNKVWNHARFEQEEEVYQTMRDLREANVDVVTMDNICNQVKNTFQ